MDIKALATQPSTWRGFALLLSLFGINVPDEVVHNASLAVIGGLGVYEFARDEYKNRGTRGPR